MPCKSRRILEPKIRDDVGIYASWHGFKTRLIGATD